MRIPIIFILVLGLAQLASSQIFVDEKKLDDFALAVAHAEGFGVRNTVPTRYHNPGDLRARRGHHYEGQVGLNRHGYVIFKNDAAGFAALKDQLRLVVSGQSKRYNTDMTISRVARVYATRWQIWAKNVAKELEVTPATTLGEYFELPPNVRFESNDKVIQELLARDVALPTLAINTFDKFYGESALGAMYASDQDNPQRQTNCI